ncbi:MAG TPA: hypothetical protein VLE49_08720 [Anaerolineales bacterium]|nr:hypothetical protein [Anaerolineales bacterium]
MGHKNDGKKNNKAHNPGKGQRNNKHPVVTTFVARAAPVTPIPVLAALAAQPELKTVSGGNGRVTTVKKWCFDSTPVYYTPDEPWPSITLGKGAIVELTGNKHSNSAAGIRTSWSEVAYEIQNPQTGMQWVTGWVNDAYLDDYNDKFPDSGVGIPHQTPNPKDAQQYMLLDGIVRYNMCGELCVAFIVEDDIDSVLARWKAKSLSSYNAILGGGRDKGTRADELEGMLKAILSDYDFRSDDDQIINLSSKLTYPVTPAGLLEDLNKMLMTHYLIAGVTINDLGELIGKENPRIKHWIVLDKIKRNGNRVEMYNPFPNKREEYSFTEFYSSFSTNSGLWVKRKKARSGSSVEDLPVFRVAIDNPNPLYRAAQYIDIDGRKKTNLCGEFCVAFIVNESINAVLERWKEVQPILYGDKVGNNKGTGTFDLRTILKGYGYNSEGDLMEFSAGLMDPYLKRSLPSPDRIAKLLKTHFLIAGVNIEGLAGQLKPGDDIRHWVVVDKLSPLGKNRGWVELYNPFFNRWEEYSYKQFINSAGYWSGLWVKRSIVPVFVEQAVESVRTEDKSRKDHRIGQWTEDQLVAAIRRKTGSEKRTNKVADQLAEQSGWKRKDVLGLLKKMAKTGSNTWIWTETKLRGEMQRRLELGKPVNKISAELAKRSGWKKRDVLSAMNRLIESQKWAEEQLLAAIKEKRKTVKATNKIVAELAKRSGWKKKDILSRLKKLTVAEKWTEPELRAETEKRLEFGTSVNRISSELANLSGWKKWEISKMAKTIKSITEEEKVRAGKMRTTMGEEPIPVVDPSTIVHASKPLEEFKAWQKSLLAQSSKLRRVLTWGEKVMIKYGFDVNQVKTSNFQAVGLYNNGSKEFGAITNFIRISHAEVMKLKAMQIEDEYVAKIENWRSQKMNWLCKYRGTIYFFDDESDQWPTAPCIRWGTLALGGNLVQVLGTEMIQAKMRDGVTRKVEMARLQGFRASDWSRPLDELLAEGLVHRCFCAYKNNHFGDSPKGIVYSPFFSVRNRDFAGLAVATDLYIPTEWLE